MERTYRVGEVAELTGVSIRTLHHYDEIGLLRPAAHSESGYRLYSEQDLLCLQQVLTLRYLGFALKQIRELLRQPDFDLVASMRIQRRALRDRISALERIEASLGELVDRRLAHGRWDWDLVIQASAVVQDGLAQKGEKMDAYYTPEQMAQFKELGEKLGPEVIRGVEERWTALMAEVRAKSDLDPASPQAQELADRWDQLTEETRKHYEGTPGLWQAIGENYKQGNFEGHDRAPQAADFAFIERVRNARQGGG